ncbi:zinc metalloprotease HtpX [Azospirillum sp. A1-3]|uniref:zinc metalloprotease HtpX n=1 Tax=Azospirillum sp. A1-3 TaxID=185874 RepID=UPI002077132A|nr:zinc metalloprotease HtpX [Azospirillum sp. A1-3]MCM8735099.1 zinc metalloprotease HtpX [Azospirillum sp. A1-3]
MPMARLDERQRRRHKLRNLGQSILLVGSLGLLVAAIGWLLSGWFGVVWSAILIGATVAFSPTVSPRTILRLYGARRLGPYDLPEVQQATRLLARRAGLPSVPELHYLATPVPNAFTVGSSRGSAIVLTDGLLRTMSLRELTGILAHEISHVRNHDLWTMGLADIISRVTSAMATTGAVLLLLSLPQTMERHGTVNWPLIVLLWAAPPINTLIQLRLSRTREFDADLDAAALTGDPEGLAFALAKLQRYDPGFWERILWPGRRNPHPSVLRTHPEIEERIGRLLSLQQADEASPTSEARMVGLPTHWARPGHRPRWRASGLWH